MTTKKRIVSILLSVLMVFAFMPLSLSEVYAAGNGGKASVKDAKITCSALTYNGKAQTPTVTVVIGQTTLVKGTDYDVAFKNPSSVDAGNNYQLTITGKGNYSGKTNVKYAINPKKITPTVTLSKTSFVYNGAVQKPAVTAVKNGTVTLTDKEYDVSYSAGCKDVGGYSVTVALKGNYTGSKTVKFKINPKGTSIKKLVKGSKLIKASWTKQDSLMSTSRIGGYQIKLATNSKFTKNKKTVNVKGYSKASKKVTKLLGGKKYYVKIRTYKKVNGTTYYSKWSKVKTVVTKR